MAGHSKYKNIMYRKGAQDKKRSAVFSKLSREITVAAKMGVPDPDMNARLRAAVNAAEHSAAPAIRVDLAALTFIDSTGVRELLCLHHRAVDADRKLTIGPCRPAVRRVFEVTGVAGVLPLF